MLRLEKSIAGAVRSVRRHCRSPGKSNDSLDHPGTSRDEEKGVD